MVGDSACFVIVGAGGLGCPALLALHSAGATQTIIVDHDRVERHNLPRQVLYDISDVGSLKVEAAARRLPALRSDLRGRAIAISEVPEFVASLSPASVVLECTDTPALKFAFNDACLLHDVPLVIGAALGWRGQALAVRRGSACYRCVYESPPPDETTARCDEAGVIGPGVGCIGMLMAHLALRFAAHDDSVAGQLWAIDLLNPRAQRLAPGRQPHCPAHAYRSSAA